MRHHLTRFLLSLPILAFAFAAPVRADDVVLPEGLYPEGSVATFFNDTTQDIPVHFVAHFPDGDTVSISWQLPPGRSAYVIPEGFEGATVDMYAETPNDGTVPSQIEITD